MVKKKFVAYIRVSTQQQGRSGLGLESQRQIVAGYVQSHGGEMNPTEFVEVETGKQNRRPQLDAALRRCRLTRSTLIVAKLDRLSRNAAFLMRLREAEVPFVACDCPEANTLTIGVMAAMAQHEREMISERTKAALAAAKARGKKLGGFRAGAGDIASYQAQGTAAAAAQARAHAELLRSDLTRLRQEGLSLAAMAERLNADHIRTRRGKDWTAMNVCRTLAYLDRLSTSS